MLFFGGAAAVGAMREIIVQARYASFQRAADRALRSRNRGHHDEAWREPMEWEPFACFNLCLNCGFLSDAQGGKCPGCGQHHWVDLREKQSAEAIRQMEHRDRREIPESILTHGRLSAGLLGIAAGMGSFFALTALDPGGALHAATAGLLGVTTAGVGFLAVPRLWNSLHFRRRRQFPARWHLPVPLPNLHKKPVRTLEGPLTPGTTELLTSPVAGQPCIGYEVSVLFDAPGDNRPPMWVLEEERNIGFEVEGQYFEPDAVTLDLPHEQVSKEDWIEDSTEVGRFLRQRGLFTSEGTYAIFEALIEPGGRYQVALYDHPQNAAAVIRPAR